MLKTRTQSTQSDSSLREECAEEDITKRKRFRLKVGIDAGSVEW